MQNSDMDADALAQQVRDCLLHLYDYAFLKAHPLVIACVPDAKGEAGRVQSFRQIVTDAINSLKPNDVIPVDSRLARTYHILRMRYLSQYQIPHILHHLNLSERQFYRDHAKAVKTLSSLLAEQAKNLQLLDSPPPAISIQSEVERVHYQGEPQRENALGFLEKTLVAIQRLTERYQAQITLHVPESLVLRTDWVPLRQTIIWLMSQYVMQSPEQCTFGIYVSSTPGYVQFDFRRITCPYPAPTQFSTEQEAVFSAPDGENSHKMTWLVK